MLRDVIDAEPSLLAREICRTVGRSIPTRMQIQVDSATARAPLGVPAQASGVIGGDRRGLLPVSDHGRPRELAQNISGRDPKLRQLIPPRCQAGLRRV